MDGKGLDISNFELCPAIEVVDGHFCHEFICMTLHCKGKGQGNEWCGNILIKQTGAQQATCISMLKPVGAQRLLVKHQR